MLAWWRTGIAASAVAVAIGGIVPHLTGLPRDRFLALGAGYGILAVAFVIGGSFRSRHAQRTLDSDGGFEAIPTTILVGVTAYISALIALTVIALL
jgi:uncharacterized membrane protein YidH (DUF202 family)